MNNKNYLARSLHDNSVYIIGFERVNNTSNKFPDFHVNIPPEEYSLLHFGREISSVDDWITFFRDNNQDIDVLYRGKTVTIPVVMFAAVFMNAE